MQSHDDVNNSGLYPWLEPCRRMVADALAQDRLPHALLMIGPHGIGKQALVHAIAGQLLCPSATPGRGACGHCDACEQLAAGSHPDLLGVGLEEDASVIKVDQIRALGEQLALSSHQGGYQLAVINPADLMNINAQNSLLKTLEEPSDNTVLLLVSERPSQLQPTVRSRCQQLRLAVPEAALAHHWLAGQGVSEPVETCLRLASGAPLEALRQSREASLEARREHFEQLLGILEGRKSAISVAELWAKDADMQGIRWMQQWLMDLLRITMSGPGAQLRSIDLQEGLQRLAHRLDSRALYAQLDRVNRTLAQASSSLNRQLQTEDILLAWAAQT